jgi:hypothetical protein
MIAFEVYLNGKKRFTAGGADYQSLTAAVQFFRLPMPAPHDATTMLNTTGVIQAPPGFAGWPTSELKVGDRVEIRLIETAKVDDPESVNTTEGNATDA